MDVELHSPHAFQSSLRGNLKHSKETEGNFHFLPFLIDLVGQF